MKVSYRVRPATLDDAEVLSGQPLYESMGYDVAPNPMMFLGLEAPANAKV